MRYQWKSANVSDYSQINVSALFHFREMLVDYVEVVENWFNRLTWISKVEPVCITSCIYASSGVYRNRKSYTTKRSLSFSILAYINS